MWPVGIVNWISFLANIATICAFFIALWAWLTWKKQQGFSDERKMLLDIEHLISEIYANAFNRFSRGVFLCKNRIDMRQLNENNPFYIQILKDSEKQLELSKNDDQKFFDLNSEYQAIKLRLELMDIKIDVDYDPNSHEKYIKKIKDQVLKCNELEELNKIAKNITYEIQNKKSECLRKMKKFRKKNYS
ncbi:hypothetical protein C5B72_13360 [Acinetobacter sp. KU 011TH]|nr:hypothetical protein C5B72_13360 [Acinetobacter sp. KU 011TH]TDM62612.1 hypothetical protein C4608_13370 [Acinetobacter sp. KU 013TH]